jgi:ABC-type siderophore export system fused ATPase/permease subunit
MWPFKKKIKEQPKSRLYGNRYNNQNYSTWDNLSIIEKFVLLAGPIGITFIDTMILELMFGLSFWVTLSISIASTIGLIILIWWITGLFGE